MNREGSASPRRWRRWWAPAGAGGLLALYAALGFWVLPLWARGALEQQLSTRTGVSARVEAVRANPFTLTLSVEGLSLFENASEPLFELGRAFVDFELSSLWRGALVFRTVEVDDPALRVTRAADGAVKWADIVARVSAPDLDAAPEAADDEEPVEVWVERFVLEGGAVALRDETTKPAFATELAPLHFEVTEFGTRAGADHAFTAESEAGERLTWIGRLSASAPDAAPAPLIATGELRLEALQLPKYRPYVTKMTPLRFSTGTAGGAFTYRVTVDRGGLSFDVRGVEVDVEGAAAHLGDDLTPFSTVEALQLRDGWFRYPDLSAGIASVHLEGGRVAVRVDEAGGTSLDPLLGRSAASSEATSTATGAAAATATDAMRFELGAFTARDFRLDAAHQTPRGEVSIPLHWTRAAVRGVRWPVTSTTTTSVDFDVIAFRTGRARVASQLGFAPLRARTTLRVDQLPLTPLQPYVQSVAHLNLPSGGLSTTGTLTVTLDDPLTGRFEGGARLDDVRAVEVRSGRDFVRWKALVVEQARVDLHPPNLEIGDVRLESPFARVLLRADGTSNVSDVFAPGGDAPASPPRSTGGGPSGPPAAFAVRSIRVRGGALDFADQSVQPRFAAKIGELGGVIERLTSSAVGSGRVALRGRVDRYAPVAIRGELHPFSSALASSLALDFENVEMTTLTPYAARFAGHTIEQGKLHVRLAYRLEGQRLEGENEMIVDRLVLGDRVESGDAVKLPVKLAVALLKDRDGRIEIDLPVSGSLEDPEFRVGKIVGRAVVNLLEKAVLAPFAALGAFASNDQAVMVPFMIGTATTTSEVREDIKKLARALAERPELILEAEGRWSPEDRRALAAARLDRILETLARRDDALGADVDDESPLEERLVRDAHRRAFGPSATGASTSTSTDLEARVLRPYAGPPPSAGARWREAPVSELRSELEEAVRVGPAALRDLAIARAEAVRDAVIGRGRIEPSRIFVLEPTAGRSGGAQLRLDAR